MDRNWNRGGGTSTFTGGGGEKNYKHSQSGGSGNYQNNNYRKKNEYSGQDFYNKIAKSAVQPLKKESLQVALIEDELTNVNFSWIKNSVVGI